MYKIYIASPYTHGWQAENVKRQIDAATLLMDNGFAPYAPLLFHYIELQHPRPESLMLQIELEFLKTCDAVFRIIPRDKNGQIIPSKGADLEEKTAKKHGIPVFHFHSVEDLKENLSRISPMLTLIPDKKEVELNIQENV
jgi:hypothetical protein